MVKWKAEIVNQLTGQAVIRRGLEPEQVHSTAYVMKAPPWTTASGKGLLSSSYLLVCMEDVPKAGICRKVNQIRNF